MKISVLTAICVMLGDYASSAQYFRMANPAHPQPVAGAFLDPASPPQSRAAALLPIVTQLI